MLDAPTRESEAQRHSSLPHFPIPQNYEADARMRQSAEGPWLPPEGVPNLSLWYEVNEQKKARSW